MRINVAQLLKGGVGDTRYYKVSEPLGEGFPIQGEIKLMRTNRSILVSGKLHTVVKSVCSRCLETFEYPLVIELEEEFFPAKSSGFSTVESEETEDFTIGEDNVLDLSEAVRQNILVNLPIKPLCRPDCAGLCPKCGKNLNYGPCSCLREQSDPRWAPLQALALGNAKRKINEED